MQFISLSLSVYGFRKQKNIMYTLTSSMKGSIGRRFADAVCKKAGINRVAKYSSQVVVSNNNAALDMKLRDRTPNPPFQASSIFSVNSHRNLNPPTRNLSTSAASSSFVGDNILATTTALPVNDSGSGGVARIGEVKKVTKLEMNVSVKINLNGSGVADSDSGIPFIDQMLHQFASHGLFDVHVKATGDIHVDDRRTNENVAVAIGTALLNAVGDKKDINRLGSFFVPHHEALVHVTLDLSGHPNLECVSYYSDIDNVKLVKHFFRSLVNASGMTLHIQKLSGSNSRHIMEATFKAFAGALRQAIEYDPRRRPLLLEHSQLQTD